MITIIVRRSAVAFAVAALIGGSAPGSLRAQIRDSGGVRIVTNHQPSWKPGLEWRLAERPALVIGRSDGDSAYRFRNIEGALRLADGRVVIANRGTSELRYYDSTGRFLFAAGGQGRGRGEFSYIVDLSQCGGDSLWVRHLTMSDQAVTVFDNAGKFVRTFTVELPDGDQVYHWRCRADGRSIATGWGKNNDPRVPMAWRPIAPISFNDRDGVLIKKIGDFPGDERHTRQMPSGAIGGSGPRPLGKRLTLASYHNSFFIGTDERYEISVYEGDGALTRIIRLSQSRIPVDDSLLARAKAEMIEAEPDDRLSIELMFEDMDIPRWLPPYHQIQVDRAGNLWVNEYVRPGEDGRWSVFGVDGVFLGWVRIPRGYQVYDIGADYLLLAGRHDGVERVELFRLIKPEAGSP